MPTSSWKASERRMARDVGTERIPVTGERNGSDFTDTLACYQLKVRRMLPAWLWAWLGGIQGTAAKQGRIGVLVLRVPRMRDEDALVVLSWRDWVALHGDAQREQD
jgi:hypothetical protein